MDRIAVDVVLLPDDEMTARAIKLNRHLAGDHTAEIVLSRTGRLPHISLAMGTLDRGDIGKLGASLRRLAQQHQVGLLHVTRILASENSRGQVVSLLEVERTGALQALHEAVMKASRALLCREATEAMVCDETVAPSTLEWIRNYAEQASFAWFQPHITIGYGRLDCEEPLPIRFRSIALAVCHLGNHCTCRKVLTRTPMT